MRYFLLASHGKLAEGMLHSLEMITGKQESVWILGAYLNEKDDIKLQIKEILKKLSSQDELVVLTDIFGGSVNNEFMHLLDDKRIHLIAGFNLPMVIELMAMNKSVKETSKLIASVLEHSKEAIKYCNFEIEKLKEDEQF